MVRRTKVRVFDGLKYQFVNEMARKDWAERDADKLRAKGRKVRIVKGKLGGYIYYSIFVR